MGYVDLPSGDFCRARHMLRTDRELEGHPPVSHQDCSPTSAPGCQTQTPEFGMGDHR